MCTKYSLSLHDTQQLILEVEKLLAELAVTKEGELIPLLKDHPTYATMVPKKDFFWEIGWVSDSGEVRCRAAIDNWVNCPRTCTDPKLVNWKGEFEN
jgi:hypothetical protein